MSRAFWIGWCTGWAALWFFAGLVSFFPFLWLLSIASIACIAVPIGKPKVIETRQDIPKQVPSSILDPRFSEEEKDRYFGK